MSAPLSHLSSSCLRPPPNSPLFPYTTLFRSFHTLWPDGPARTRISCEWLFHRDSLSRPELDPEDGVRFWDTTDRKSTRLNSSHVAISYAVFCLKKKKENKAYIYHRHG